MHMNFFFFFLVFTGYTIKKQTLPSLAQLATVEFGHQGSADRPHIFACIIVKGHLFRTCSVVGLLEYRGRVVKMPASVRGAYDCSVCYVWYEASPERLAAPGTAGDSHPSVTLHRERSDESLLFAEADMNNKRNILRPS